MPLPLDQYWPAERPSAQSNGPAVLIWVKSGLNAGNIQYSDGDDWLDVITSNNAVTLDTEQTITGAKAFQVSSASAAVAARNDGAGVSFSAGTGFGSSGALRVGKNGDNEVVTINLVNEILPATSSFLVAKTVPAGAGYVVSDCLANIGGASGDCGAMRALIVQTVPGIGTGIRAGEFHTGRGALAAGGLGTWVLELGLHTAFAGAGVGDNVGIRLTSEPNASFGASPAARANEGLFIVGGDGAGNGGWTNAIRYEENGVVLFNVSQAGTVTAGNLVGRGATATYDLGTSSNVWRIVYGNTHMAEAGGSPTTPTYTFRTAPTVGAYLGAGNTYCISGGGAQYLGIDGNGNIVPGTAALATNAVNGWTYIETCAGAPTGVPAGSYAGRVPIVFDTTNNKLYVYDGGWLATAALV